MFQVKKSFENPVGKGHRSVGFTSSPTIQFLNLSDFTVLGMEPHSPTLIIYGLRSIKSKTLGWHISGIRLYRAFGQSRVDEQKKRSSCC